MEKEFEECCLLLSAGKPARTEVSYDIDNMFYERFGMSYEEVSDKLYGRYC